MRNSLEHALQARIAAANRKSELAVDPIPRRPADIVDIPLSSGQQRLWYMAQIEPNSAVNNAVGAFRLTGPLDIEGLESALNGIVQRHEVLRTELRIVDEAPTQQIQPEWQLHLEVKDFSSQSADALREEIIEEVLRPFDLTTLPLFRWHLYQLGEAEHVLLLVTHHCVIDGISISRLLYEAGERYRSFVDGTKCKLESVKLQYADYAIWQRDWLKSEEAKRQLEFWVELHQGADTPLDLPLDHPRPREQSYRGDGVLKKLDSSALARFEGILKQEKSTVFMGLLSVLSILLQKYSRQASVNVGVPFAGRGHSDIRDSFGFFVNTLVYHLAVDPEDSFTDHLRKTREACFDSFRNQDIPFDQVVRAINPPRDTSRTPLYQVFFGYQDQRGRQHDFGDIRVEPYETDIGVARTDLALWVEHDDDGLSLALEYCTDLFERSTALRILEHFENLIRLSAEHPQSAIWQLNPLSESEQALQLTANRSTRDFPYSDALSLLLDAARQHPDKTAIVFEDEQISYAQLMQRSATIAGLLEKEGFQPGSIVGIYMDRSSQMIASILGIWMAGCAYLPLDPEFPENRLQYMVDKSRAAAILTCTGTNRDAIDGAQFIEVDTNPSDVEQGAIPGAFQSVSAESLGYIIFTSGSTGQPKGALVHQRAIANLLQSMSIRPGFSSNNRLLAVTTLSFDISVLELLLPLSVGGLVIVSKEAALNAVELIRLLTAHEVDTLQATPATWKMLLSEHWRPNKEGFRALCGGEAMPKNIASNLLDAGCELWNMYGPTETTVWSTCSQITDSHFAITLGEPIHNTECFVVDTFKQLCPIGVPGELLIAGDGVSEGYIGEADLTRERFVDLDIPGTNGSRKAYRTGDIVVRNAEGGLLYKGRDDDQIKLRGYRIEIGEIESSLLSIDGIMEVAVIVKIFGTSDSRLLAFVRFDKGFQAPTTELRRRLKDLLPAYMIPQQFILVTEMPLTANGKVDRKALARLGAGQPLSSEHVEPVTETERKVARICSESLQVEKVSIDQNFFDIGGHSLLAISVIQKIDKEFSVRISPRDMMLNTLQQIAKLLSDQQESRVEVDNSKMKSGSSLARLRRFIGGSGK